MGLAHHCSVLTAAALDRWPRPSSLEEIYDSRWCWWKPKKIEKHDDCPFCSLHYCAFFLRFFWCWKVCSVGRNRLIHDIFFNGLCWRGPKGPCLKTSMIFLFWLNWQNFFAGAEMFVGSSSLSFVDTECLFMLGQCKCSPPFWAHSPYTECILYQFPLKWENPTLG